MSPLKFRTCLDKTFYQSKPAIAKDLNQSSFLGGNLEHVAISAEDLRAASMPSCQANHVVQQPRGAHTAAPCQ